MATDDLLVELCGYASQDVDYSSSIDSKLDGLIDAVNTIETNQHTVMDALARYDEATDSTTTLLDSVDGLGQGLTALKTGQDGIATNVQQLSLGYQAYDDSKLRAAIGNIDLDKLANSLPEILDYQQQLGDIATLMSYMNILLVIVCALLFLLFGLGIGYIVVRMLKVRAK